MPPNPQFWRSQNFKVPHFTPKLGGHGGREGAKLAETEDRIEGREFPADHFFLNFCYN